ncbi:MerR family transcriptional regulator [Companilactobacillus zhongbaensis]|uniref:MerR family transcriptional regulator n=1 Tax=Companilactobacillus zhongbaensis TaxID=2486009 RepID=UPI000F7B14FF|nr:MerR family transcriptional regulator [Companilactobacillus zhongbaensis]
MEKLFSIGQLGKIFNIAIPTLRYYDEVGLLNPAKVDPDTHYRYYSTEQFERLNVITYLRALDLSVESIKEFFQARDTTKLEDMLVEQKERVNQQIHALQQIDQRIDARLNQVQDAANSVLEKIELVELPQIPIISLNEDYRPNEDIEFPISTLRRKYGLDKNIFLGKIVLTLNRQQLMEHEFDEYNSLLLILEPGDGGDATGYLPAGEYVRVRFHGTHQMAGDCYRKLLKYCQDKQLEIVDDAIETALIDYGITDNFDKYVTEIKIPVKKQLTLK